MCMLAFFRYIFHITITFLFKKKDLHLRRYPWGVWSSVHCCTALSFYTMSEELPVLGLVDSHVFYGQSSCCGLWNSTDDQLIWLLWWPYDGKWCKYIITAIMICYDNNIHCALYGSCSYHKNMNSECKFMWACAFGPHICFIAGQI